MSAVKVAIVEDDRRIRESLAVLLEGSAGFRCVDAYANAESALKEIPREWPDAVLMDINLPQMSGIECAAKLKALRPELQIIMLTVYVDSDQIFQSLKAGASGYLIKDTPPAEVLAAITEVHRGGSPMSSAIARKVVQHFQKQQEPLDITRREQEILTHLSKGYFDKEIAEMLSISVPTLRTHIRNIYEKLQVRSRAAAVAKFLGAGN
jgi:DNA-binding NarL/FixJ family response regulator